MSKDFLLLFEVQKVMLDFILYKKKKKTAEENV